MVRILAVLIRLLTLLLSGSALLALSVALLLGPGSPNPPVFSPQLGLC